MSAARLPLSAVVITYREADRLARCLAALSFCDEVLVVDSGSDDGTTALATSMGARVIVHRFEGYGPQKHFAFSEARHEWILSVDADEIVTEGLARSIKEVFTAPQGPTAGSYRMRRQHVFLGRALRYGGERRSGYVRLFDRRKTQVTLEALHESIPDAPALGGRPSPLLGGCLEHHSYRSLEDYLERFNRYSSQAAAGLRAQGVRPRSWQVYFRMPINLFRLLFLKGLILDGYAGFVWAFLSSVYPVVKYAKLAELWVRETPAGRPASTHVGNG